MTLIYLLVVAAAVVYIVLTAMKYSEYVQITKPYIEEVAEKNKGLEEDIEGEKEATREVISQVKDEEILVDDFKMAVEKVEEEIAEEKDIEGKLELAKQMKQFTRKT